MGKIGNRLQRVKAVAHNFRGDDRGNVAMIFAVSLVPLLGFVGAAVDYSRANAAKAAIQVALDSAALMVSKDLSGNPTMSTSDITLRATQYFNALYTNKNAGTVTVTADYATNTDNGSTVTLTGTGEVTTDFMKMIGFPKIGIGGGATTTWGMTRMRVAMALDVTGSMKDAGKMAAMQSAAKGLVDTLRSTAKDDNDVYISIVPFAAMVNVGATNVDAKWIKWGDWEDVNGNWTIKNWKWVWVPADHAGWNGCVTDRDQPYDTTNDLPNGQPKLFPANQYNACPASILPMTSAYSLVNSTLIKAKIDTLLPNGGTNQPIGMAWAWQTLQMSGPFPSPAKDSGYKYSDVIIILSDGQNTVDRWYGDGTAYDARVDARQTLLCNNIKAEMLNGKQKTAIYTIQVNTDGDPESAVLKACADAGNFYPTSTASGIASAFTAIGSALTQLRVAK